MQFLNDIHKYTRKKHVASIVRYHMKENARSILEAEVTSIKQKRLFS